MAAAGALFSSYILQGNRHHNARFVARSLNLLAILYILVLFSTYPYQLNQTFSYIHQAISSLLYLYMTALGLYLTFNMPRAYTNLYVRYTLFISFLIALFTYFGFIHLLFYAELITGLAFGIILVKYLRLIQKYQE